MSRMFKKTVALWRKMWYNLSIFINVFMNNVRTRLEALGSELDRSIAYVLHITAAIGAGYYHEAYDMMLFGSQGATYDEGGRQAEYNNARRFRDREIVRIQREIVKLQREIVKLQRERDILQREREIVRIQREIDRLQRERDILQREICRLRIERGEAVTIYRGEIVTHDEARIMIADNNRRALERAEPVIERYRILADNNRRALERAAPVIERGEAVDAVVIRDASIPEYSNHMISPSDDSQGEQSAQVTPRCNIDALIVVQDNAIRVNDASVNENTDSNKSIEQSVVRSRSQIFSAQNKEREQCESDNDIDKPRIDFYKIPNTNNNDSARSQGLEDDESELVTQRKDISKHKTPLVKKRKDISTPVLQYRVTGPSYCWGTTSSLRKNMAVDAVHKNRAFGMKKIPRQMLINH